VLEPSIENFIVQEEAAREVAVAGRKPADPVPHDQKESSPEENGSSLEDSAYTVQLASFRNRDNAIDEVRKLKKRGVKADYTYKGGWFQVFAYGYATKQEALKAKEEGKEKVILFNWSGHGLVDMAAYEAYLHGKLADHELEEEAIQKALDEIAPLPKPRQYTG